MGNTPSSLVATGVMVRMQVLGTRTGTTLRRTRIATSRVVASVTILVFSLCKRYGITSRPFIIWSAILSCFGEYISRFGMPLVVFSELGYQHEIA